MTSSLENARKLESVLYSNRILYINHNPLLTHRLPFENGWRMNDLADEIARGCVEYDITYTWQNAKVLAQKITKELGKDVRHFYGGFDLGWD